MNKKRSLNLQKESLKVLSGPNSSQLLLLKIQSPQLQAVNGGVSFTAIGPCIDQGKVEDTIEAASRESGGWISSVSTSTNRHSEKASEKVSQVSGHISGKIVSFVASIFF